MAKRKKRKLSEEFEEIYLRYGTAKKYLHKVSSEELSSGENQSIITHMASKYYEINKSILFSVGYNFDDIRNIAAVFAATFLGSDCKIERGRGKNLVMMRYIDQRMSRFIKWAARKFNINEIVSCTSIKDDYGIEHSGTLNSVIEIDGIPMWGGESPISLREQIIENEIELEILAKCPDPKKKKRILGEQKNLKKEYRKEIKEGKECILRLREELNRNPEKHTEQLVFYATSKHVADDIRRAAKRYCKKFDIDYNQMAIELIEKNQYEDKDFIING